MKTLLLQKTFFFSFFFLTLLVTTTEKSFSQADKIHDIRVAVLFSSNPDVPTTKNEIVKNANVVFDESNDILKKSGVNMKLEFVAVSEISFKENKSIDEFARNLVNVREIDKITSAEQRAEFQNISYIRKLNDADIICYVHRKASPDETITNDKGEDVIVKDTLYTNGANPHGFQTAFFKINFYAFQASRRIFLHEMSHLFGLTHEMGAAVPYEIGNEGKITIMATNCAHTMADTFKDKNNPDKFIDNEKEFKMVFSGINPKNQSKKYYSKCNWDAVTVLNENAHEYSTWGETFFSEPYTPKSMAKNLKDISLVNDCVAWGIDGKNRLWKWDRYRWDKIETDRRFVQLSAKNFDTVFLIDDKGTVITYDDYTKVFGVIPHHKEAMKIATNTKGNIWIVDEETKVYERRSGKFTENGPAFKISDISIDNNNKAYILNGNNLMKKDGSSWVTFLSDVKKVDIGVDGTLCIIDSDNKIRISINGERPKLIRNNIPSFCHCEGDEKINCRDIDNNIGIEISVYNKDRIWVLSEGKTYKYVGGNGFQEVYELGATFSFLEE